jgi:cation diffusion facilitator CzcD-associated flavoprotein CzcO
MALGLVSHPQLSGTPGFEDFAVHMFHTSRWDFAYTGCGPEEPMDRLRDRRIAVIGTGASAVQSVPRLGRDAAEVVCFSAHLHRWIIVVNVPLIRSGLRRWSLAGSGRVA